MGFPEKGGRRWVIEQGREPEPDKKRSEKEQKDDRKPSVIIHPHSWDVVSVPESSSSKETT